MSKVVNDNKIAMKALRKSIKHWCIDIRKNMLNGDSIRNSAWVKSGIEVKMYARDCELCIVYMKQYTGCKECPLHIIGKDCGMLSSTYYSFRRKLDLESAHNVILELIYCYRKIS